MHTFSCKSILIGSIVAASLVLPLACQQNTTEESTAAKAPVKPQTPPDPPLLTTETAPGELATYGQANPETLVVISTPKGDIKIRLYEDTPLHRANFVRLAKYGYFDQTVFYRVEQGFMIQGGNSEERTMKIGAYKIPAEILPKYYHKRGAIGMARYDEGNPNRLSSSHDFYIVQGHPYSPEELQATMQEYKLDLSPKRKKEYQTVGGAPNLDQQYTVFGEVIEGIEVVDSIAAVAVDKQNWPLKDVPMKVKVVKE